MVTLLESPDSIQRLCDILNISANSDDATVRVLQSDLSTVSLEVQHHYEYAGGDAIRQYCAACRKRKFSCVSAAVSHALF